MPARLGCHPTLLLVIVFCVVATPPLLAQQARPALFAVDTSVSLDQTAGGDDYITGATVDGVVSVGLGGGFEGIVRPFAQRLSSGEWNRQIWIAAVRYERSGAIGVRVDGGLIPSPIGLANLTLRPHQNPTISQPSSLFTSLPPLYLRAPRTTLLGAVYPFGGQITLSTQRWDLRAALIDSSPLRTRRVFAEANPPRFANVVLGGGVTPFVGFRIGVSATHGGWLREGEATGVTSDHDATVIAVESEFSVAHTRLSGEWVRDRIETDAGDFVVSGWFIQGHQTLAPRWFVAARAERMSSPLVTPLLAERQRLLGFEQVIGFRLTPEITLRLGHRARRGFGRPGYDHQGQASIVWWRRWM